MGWKTAETCLFLHDSLWMDTMKITLRQTGLIVCTVFAVLLQVRAQVSYAEFQTEEDPGRKAGLGLELWNYYLRNDFDSLKILGVELMLYAAEKQHPFSKAVGQHALGSYLIRRGELEKGLFHLNEAKNYYTRREDYDQISLAYNELGNARYLQGKYHEAIKMYLSSLKFGGMAPDHTNAFNAKIGLGKAYVASGDTLVGIQSIIEYKDKAAQNRKFESVADAYAFLGEVEMDRNPRLSKSYYEKSVIFSVKSKSQVHLSHAYNNSAILFFNLGQNDSSLFYFQKALDIRLKMKHAKAIAESYYNLGYFYRELGEPNEALKYFDQSVQIAKANGLRGDERDALLEVKDICTELRLYRLDEVLDRIKALEKELQLKETDDKEIIEYAEKVIRESKMKEEQVRSESGGGMLLWWLLGAGIVLTLIIWLFRKKS